MKRSVICLLSIMACVFLAGCVAQPTKQSNSNASPSTSPVANVSPSPANEKAANAEPITLPVLDAFFADQSFPELLKTRLRIGDEQIGKLKELARDETARLNETNAGQAEGESASARAMAEEKISGVIGKEKAAELAALVRERWGSLSDDNSDKTANDSKSKSDQNAGAANSVP